MALPSLWITSALLLGHPALSAQILSGPAIPPGTVDWREINAGRTIPDEEYVDQPYLIRCDDGAWLCTLTTSRGGEGATTSHVVATRSTDQGRTWSTPVPLEAETPPESAYATLLKVAGGRIFAFYDHNSENIREIPGENGGKPVKRVDTLGQFVFRTTDDGGRTWSTQRHVIPVRETQIDRANVTGGRTRIFWHVGRPLVHGGAVFLPFAKMTGVSNLSRSESYFLRSDNLLTEPDPAKIRWATLPDGETGLRAPRGIIAEEPSLVALSDGTLFCVYRTAAGRPAHATSHDGGHTWSTAAFLTYAPGGREVKHTRAANFIWRTAAGRYLYWFHNHEVPDFNGQRNPAWVAGGREIDTPAGRTLAWSEPEILLHAPEAATRMSYPDLLEDGGRYFVSETQKTVARIHEIPSAFLDMLWAQPDTRQVATGNLVADLNAAACAPGKTAKLPAAFDLEANAERGGLTLECWVKFTDLAPGQTLFDSRSPAGTGFTCHTTDRGTVQVTLRGAVGGPGRANAVLAETGWDCDAGLLQPGTWHHLVVILDGGAKLVLFVVDGRVGDGGAARPYGWARLPRELRMIPTTATLRLAPSLHGELGRVRVYSRRLYVSEAVGNGRAGLRLNPARPSP